MKRYLTEEQVIDRLKNAQSALSQEQFANNLGISQQMLSDVLRGRRGIPEKVLDYLGLEAVEKLYQVKR